MIIVNSICHICGDRIKVTYKSGESATFTVLDYLATARALMGL